MIRTLASFATLWLLVPFKTTSAFEYTFQLVDGGEISLTDVATDISDIKTLFNGEPVYVAVSGLEWEEKEEPGEAGSELLAWETYVDNQLASNGVHDLNSFGKQLPGTLDVGNITVHTSGSHTIMVKFIGSANMDKTVPERTLQSYAAGVSVIPLIVVLLLAMTTQMVEFSLFVTVFIGACMVSGGIKAGFQTTLDTYILENLADVDHGYVYLFSLFLSGLVAMLQKSGGMIGFTTWISQYAKSPRAAQLAIFSVTLLCFFDDYTNLLLTGQSMSALANALMVSKEKLAFLVDGTAAPLASLTPVSAWVGFEVSLIQAEIDNLVSIYGEENLTISTSGINVFLQSIKYRYYPIFMLFLITSLIILQRDMGPMLLAERKVRVYGRTDGGDGRLNRAKAAEAHNEPRTDTPHRSFNMIAPVLLLIFFIFYLMVQTGNNGSGDQSFTDMIENSHSFKALLWGTMATTIITALVYLVQIVQDGNYVMPSFSVLKSCLFSSSAESKSSFGDQIALHEDEEEAALIGNGSSKAHSLLSIYESVESFLYGMGRLFPTLIVLTLAWATGDIMTSVGADRFFSQVIRGGVAAEAMPTLSFVLAVILALAIGSSWSTMTILFPLLMVPTYQVSNGDELIFYSTVAGILSGSVAGDHMSPISDTTVISAMSCDCKLLNHVLTQAPYAILVIILCILFGTIPIGQNAMPNIVGILLALVFIIGFVFLACAPIESPTGRYDIFSELIMKCRPIPELEDLRQVTIKHSNDTSTDEPTVAINATVSHDTEDEPNMNVHDRNSLRFSNISI